MGKLKPQLLFVSLCSFVAFGLCAIFVYKNYLHKRDVLGAQHITRIDKQFIVYPHERVFKHFYESKPGIVQQEQPDWLSYEATYHINHDGLNDYRDYSYDKPNSTYRIVTLGDSFTFGQYVNTKDSYPRVLEELLPSNTCKTTKKYEVINFGEPGYDIGYAVERYRIRGAKYQPDVVIWLLNEHNFLRINDLVFESVEKLSKAITEEEKKTAIQNKDLYYVWNKATEEFSKTYGKGKILEYQKSQFQRLLSLYRGKLVFVVWSELGDEYKQLLSQTVRTRPNTYLFEGISNTRIKEIGGSLLDGHPNKIGYDYISREIYSYLIDNRLLSCPNL